MSGVFGRLCVVVRARHGVVFSPVGARPAGMDVGSRLVSYSNRNVASTLCHSTRNWQRVWEGFEWMSGERPVSRQRSARRDARRRWADRTPRPAGPLDFSGHHAPEGGVSRLLLQLERRVRCWVRPDGGRRRTGGRRRRGRGREEGVPHQVVHTFAQVRRVLRPRRSRGVPHRFGEVVHPFALVRSAFRGPCTTCTTYEVNIRRRAQWYCSLLARGPVH